MNRTVPPPENAKVPVGEDVLNLESRAQARAAEFAEYAALMRRIAVGRDEAAFQTLFATFGPRVKGMVMRRGCQAQVAEDIAQEAMLSVWRKASLYESSKGSVATWVFTIARNLMIDRIRRETVFQALDEDRPEEASDAPIPDQLVESSQIQHRMRAVLSELPADQVEVVMAAYIDGLSHSQIAEKFRLPMGTVKSRMRLAYQKIRTAFEGYQ